MEFFSEYSVWFLPIGITAAGFLIGLIVEHLLLGRLRRAASETAWEWDDFVVKSLGHAPTLLFTAAGAYVGLLVADYALARETLNRAMLVLLILAGTAVAARLVGALVSYSTSRPGSSLPSSSLLTNLARVFVYLIGIVIILQSLEIPITPLITTLGIGGLAVALALQPTLSNVFAGFQMLAAGQVSAGDSSSGGTRPSRASSTTMRSSCRTASSPMPSSPTTTCPGECCGCGATWASDMRATLRRWRPSPSR
jgi:small-conductance mechanosensitive channel